MSEKPSKRPHSFFGFWGIAIKEGGKKSWEKFGRAIEVAALLLGLGVFFVVWYAKHHRDFNAASGEEFVNYWLAIIPLGIGFAWFVYHVFRAPYDIYLKQWKEAEAERNAHAEQMRQKEVEIIALNGRLAEKSAADKLVEDRKMAKELLGYSLSYLRIRRNEIREIGYYSFEGEIIKTEDGKTMKVIDRACELLNTYLGPAETEMFNGAKPSPLPATNEFDMFTARKQEWTWRLVWLDAKYDELKRIIDKMG